MKLYTFLIAAAPLALATQSLAQSASKPSGSVDKPKSSQAANAGADSDVVSTAVAKGRDRLDSSISTSSIKEVEVQKLSARSLGEVLRNIPGIRVEVGNGEGSANISIRGLPIASTGAKFLQIEEDGLPVLEFGDIALAGADNFMRVDLNLAQIEAIRGGSASTFASNSPSGVINLISKTGDVEGGSIQATAGLDYENYRVDFDYGAKLSDTLRFHIGGFYRQGEGPRKVGYDAYKGGQIKFNVTKQFSNGYIRLYGKYLDDRVPTYLTGALRVTGTDSDPKYSYLTNYNTSKGALLSPNLNKFPALDGNNNIVTANIANGQSPLVKSVGAEAQFDFGEWTVTERFRYSDISSSNAIVDTQSLFPADDAASALRIPGVTLSYGSGPNAGQPITNPAGLNGNGLAALVVAGDVKLYNLNNVTNDIRLSRVWEVGGGDLTTTGGFYKSRQNVSTNQDYIFAITDVRADGNASYIDVRDGSGALITQNGILSYDASFRRKNRAKYDVNAAFGSVNFHIGRLAIGGSLRYDFGNAGGSVFGSSLGGGRVGTATIDINRNGVISPVEQAIGVLPLSQPGPIDYKYHYLSYSTGVNFRVAEPLAVFARYSRGGRANSDRLLFTSAVSSVDGSLLNKSAAIDYVRQAEAGVKYRKDGLTLNLTGFWASSTEHNEFFLTVINRKYRAYGAEFEGGYRTGPFSIAAGATYTHAEIASDAFDQTIVGNRPKNQPKFFFQATPQIESGPINIGANVFGTTSSYSQDVNQLKIPGYTLVNPFVQFRPIERLVLALNVNNVFDKRGITSIQEGSIPPSGIVLAQMINGRTISTSARFFF